MVVRLVKALVVVERYLNMVETGIKLSIIIPVYNDAIALKKLLSYLYQYLNKQTEVIVVDGGSSDHSLAEAKKYNHHVVCSVAGRAKQMNAGAAVAKGDYLWFLHADSQFVENPIPLLLTNASPWLRFKIKLDGTTKAFRMIESMMNWRTCITGIVTGDHAMLIKKSLFNKVGGFDDIALMEDIELSKKLKGVVLECSNHIVVTSSRKWQKNGITKTIFLMWWLRLNYFFGVDAKKLHSIYYPK